MAAPGSGGSFGEQLRLLRAASGLTQEALAFRSGLSVDAISALESGRRRRPHTETIRMLADALDLGRDERESLTAAAVVGGQPRSPRTPSGPPRELPPECGDFVGRDDELAVLLARGDHTVTWVSGMGGVGKSALVIRAAHALAGDFPDGQIYLDLRGATPGLDPLDPVDALGHVLRALGVRPELVPARVEEASARFRSLAAGRRLLIVLDGAFGGEQVRPLLPGSPTCRVLVTSRRAMTSVEGVRHLPLEVFSPVQAVELLGRVAGPDRVAAEPDAAGRVADLCGGLPLAVRIAGARLSSRPVWSLEELSADLADAVHRLEALEVDGLSVRATFEVSVRTLERSDREIEREAAAVFGLLALPDGPDLSVATAARLLEQPERAVRSLLERLVDARLLETPRPGRYRFHDLVRLCARERVGRERSTDERAAVLVNVMAFFTATAWRALALQRPGDRRLAVADPRWTDGGLDFADASAAGTWLDAERANLVAAVRQTAAMEALDASGVPAELPGQLARALFGFLARGHLRELVQVNTAALEVARHRDDRAGQAASRNDLGLALEGMGRYAEAMGHHEDAIRLSRTLGDRHGEAGGLTNLGLVASWMGRHEEAIGHHRRSLDIFRGLSDRRGEASALTNLGVAHARAGEDDEAVACLREGLRAFGALGASQGQAAVLHELGSVLDQTGRHEEAIACQRQSLDLYRSVRARLGSAYSLMGLGRALTHVGRYGEAIESLRESLAICREVGAGREETVVLRDLGDALMEAGLEGEAAEVWQEAVDVGEPLAIPETAAIRDRLGDSSHRG